MTDTIDSVGVAAHARVRPEKIAIVASMADGVERRMTYRELDERITRAARALANRGIGRGDRVLISLRNRPEMLEVALGAARLRAEVVCAAWRSTPDELAYLARDADASIVVAEESARAATATLGLPAIHVGDEYEDVLAAESSEPLDPVGVDYVNLHVYTSGTTGRPKAIQLPGFNARHAIVEASQHQSRFGLEGPDEVVLAVCPLHHLAGWSYPHTALVLGQTVVLVDGFDPERVLASIERERVTYLNLVPYHFIRIAALPADVVARYDLSSVRALLHGSAPCPVDVKWRMMEIFGPDIIWETYGGSEGMASAISPSEWREHPGSVGKPTTELQILDDEGRELPSGEPGLIYLTPRMGVRFEYRGDAEQSKALWHGDLFTLGDIGYLDDDGYLFLVDRKKDVIVTGGANVYPAEVEVVLREHPAVAEAAVVGVPDAEWGERVHAVVVANAAVEPEELVAFCRERLLRGKCPSSVELVVELPRDPMGKVRKRELRDRYWAGHARKI